ncbi:isoprenoid biosynthesis glyoxalase ElbB [Venenivibrio stagnispumantis]|uniref:Enhancing lycopene biosynthesis protein 2 n=1 Tax=Venenivibrio stagnispumantis TaxID=407998 RepID=A0AA45WKB9_9AQUI|nr:isoprenoid biosynthesis glyoxalase ElbB [Venenivibrio stagnispumantis]MCW4573520.1 isoprenoid biosynthesis glyoxalase ElbB [Venenivibrio stagnispumantis]SMP06165.1 Enhancing lycopene biosynthesis protein 2 [Venenivibrio stagnispumantis]
MKVGVLLAGCGVFDGAEIHEATLTLYFLDKEGVEIVCMAPNIPQKDVINHLTGQPMDEKRNVLIEAARIARGNIKDIDEVSVDDIDALIMPGGYGVAKNFSNFLEKGADAEVIPQVKRLLVDLFKAGKPIGAICISPVIVASALREAKPTVTIGTDIDVAKTIEAMGAKHLTCPVNEMVVDEEHKIVTTPAYMLGKSIKDVAEGIEKLVKEVIKLAKK